MDATSSRSKSSNAASALPRTCHLGSCSTSSTSAGKVRGSPCQRALSTVDRLVSDMPVVVRDTREQFVGRVKRLYLPGRSGPSLALGAESEVAGTDNHVQLFLGWPVHTVLSSVARQSLFGSLPRSHPPTHSKRVTSSPEQITFPRISFASRFGLGARMVAFRRKRHRAAYRRSCALRGDLSPTSHRWPNGSRKPPCR